jgi:Tol biopolymer transport system component
MIDFLTQGDTMLTQKLFAVVTILLLLFGVVGCDTPLTVTRKTNSTETPSASTPPLVGIQALPLAVLTETPSLPATQSAIDVPLNVKVSSVYQLARCNPQCLGPAWLSGGKQLSYFNGGSGQIRVTDLQGQAVRIFVLPPGSSLLAWSPDGQWMAFSTLSDTKNSLMVMPVDGDTPIPVFSGPTQINNLTWSSDSKFIFFVLTKGDLSSKIMKVATDGSSLEQVAAFPPGLTDLALSPDAKSAVYITLSDSGRPDALRLVKIGASKSRVLFDQGASTPAWSPDGQKISFATDDPDSEICVINVDGTGLIKVTQHAGYADRGAVWSPDGTCLAFTANTVNPAGIYSADEQVYILCNWNP